MDAIDTLLDELSERIGKRRDDNLNDWIVHDKTPADFSRGVDRGFYVALLEIADMRRERDQKLGKDLDSRL